MAKKRKEAVSLAKRSPCPVACALDVLGDKWTLLVIRDLIQGKRRYGEFLDSAESIPTNILADRLKRLENHNIVKRTLYQHKPDRYEYALTARGLGLGPILRAMFQWGKTHW